LIWVNWPDSSLYIIGLFIGLDLLFTGVAMSIAAASMQPHGAKY
jgi:uncharacterized membrane protein HdeD (DUF308 family)